MEGSATPGHKCMQAAGCSHCNKIVQCGNRFFVDEESVRQHPEGEKLLRTGLVTRCLPAAHKPVSQGSTFKTVDSEVVSTW